MAKKKKEFKQVVVGEDGQPAEYLRSRWKHYIRWMVFCFVMFLYFSLMLMSYRAHFMQGHGFVLKEVIAFFMCSLMLVPILPSVVLEVDWVKVEDDGIIFQNLIVRRKEKWEDLIKFSNPLYLKFAIVRSKRFIYLLNRRDIPGFDQLAERIRVKTDKLIQ